jgi:hypothetical protein
MSVLMKRRLMRLSAATRATNSSTTAVIAGLPPSRSNSGPAGGPGGGDGEVAATAGVGGAGAGGAVAGGVSAPVVAHAPIGNRTPMHHANLRPRICAIW